MAVFDEAEGQLVNALAAWDFSPAFPNGYSGTKAVVIAPGWPPDIIDNIVSFNNGQMTEPIVSVAVLDASDNFRTLGSVYGPGTGGLTRYGTRAEIVFSVTCWADQQLGGGDLARKLAGQIEGCCFYNRSRLAALRPLRCRASHEVYFDRPQLWRVDLTVHGSAIVSYDA